jgi:uncharacterized protein
VKSHASVLLVVVAVACAAQEPKEPATTAAAQPAVVVVETRDGRQHRVTVEVARTDAERARGLMNRAELAPDAGMLFLFSETDEHAFWMKNTFIPLDMIFIDEGGRVAGLVERATPGSLALRSIGAPSRYVLEVNGGWAEARAVRPGDRVRFENVKMF